MRITLLICLVNFLFCFSKKQSTEDVEIHEVFVVNESRDTIFLINIQSNRSQVILKKYVQGNDRQDVWFYEDGSEEESGHFIYLNERCKKVYVTRADTKGVPLQVKKEGIWHYYYKEVKQRVVKLH